MGRLFLRLNERDYNIYNEEHQETPDQGRCLTFCITKIVGLPRTGKAFCFLIIQNRKNNDNCCCGCDRAGRY
jgi:hypothetical protein